MRKSTVIGLGIAGLALLGGGCASMFVIGYKVGVQTLTGVIMEATSEVVDKIDNEKDIQVIEQFVSDTHDATKHVDPADAYTKTSKIMKERKKSNK